MFVDRARITIKSAIMDFAPVNSGNAGNKGDINNDRLTSRRFIFEITRVEGNATLVEGDTHNKHEFYCYLRGRENFYITDYGRAHNGGYNTNYWADCYGMSPLVVMNNDNPIGTEFLYGDKKVSGDLNYQFDDEFKKLLSTGQYKLGISILGKCKEEDYNSDGPVTFDLYYTYQGKKQKALSLVVEGEFDDSTFFGWELAFEYMKGVYEEDGDGVNIDDYMEDNFMGDD